MSMSPIRFVILALLGLAALVSLTVLFYMVFLSAGAGSQPVDEGAVIFTQAAQTLNVQLTQVASNATGTAGAVTPTYTRTVTPQLPTNTPRATNTPLPIASNTPLPTPTGMTPGVRTPISTPGAPSNNTPIGTPGTPGAFCNAAKFIEDVSIPDGTKINPGTGFTKTWRLENYGTCTWTTDYKVVFIKGDQMSAPAEVPMPETVKPGERVDISINMIAPVQAGEYENFWKLSPPNGPLFGTGTFAENSIWTIIEVKEVKSGLALDFVTSACAATWVSGAGTLPCPGKEGDANGFVIPLTNPSLESHNEDELALLTHPQSKDNGYITGTYPAFTIKEGDEFIADIGCMSDSDKCNVLFRLDYRNSNGNVNNIGEWKEVYDGVMTTLRLDLSDLSGKSVQFMLTVSANGSASDDNAVWFVPQIQRD